MTAIHPEVTNPTDQRVVLTLCRKTLLILCFYTEELKHRLESSLCFCLPDRGLSSVHSHPCLLRQTQQLLHVGTPIVHHILRAPRLPEVYDPSGSVYSRPDSARHDQPREDFFGLLRSKIKERSKTGQGNSGVVFGDYSNVLRKQDEQG